MTLTLISTAIQSLSLTFISLCRSLGVTHSINQYESATSPQLVSCLTSKNRKQPKEIKIVLFNLLFALLSVSLMSASWKLAVQKHVHSVFIDLLLSGFFMRFK